jgi:hypothetical protein
VAFGRLVVLLGGCCEDRFGGVLEVRRERRHMGECYIHIDDRIMHPTDDSYKHIYEFLPVQAHKFDGGITYRVRQWRIRKQLDEMERRD